MIVNKSKTWIVEKVGLWTDAILLVTMRILEVSYRVFFQFNFKIFTKFIEYTKKTAKFAVSIGVVN